MDLTNKFFKLFLHHKKGNLIDIEPVYGEDDAKYFKDHYSRKDTYSKVEIISCTQEEWLKLMDRTIAL